jgi:integral membrane protein
MDELMKTKIGWLRVVAFLEGVSFLLLLGIAMPLKYVWGMPEYVRAVGMAHGLLFMAFLGLVAVVGASDDWSPRKYLLAFLASVLPFGTFWADVKLFRN